MINTLILAKVYELREALLKSDEYVKVKESENIMEEKCSSLLIKYNNLFDEYNQAIRFVKYGSNIEMIQKELARVKLELDNNEYVKDYKNAYKEMNLNGCCCSVTKLCLTLCNPIDCRMPGLCPSSSPRSAQVQVH